jgi:hypothetical protein
MNDRAKAVMVAGVAAVMGIGGVLAVEAVTGFRPGVAPAASIARVDEPHATATLLTSSLSPSAVPKVVPTVKPTPTPTTSPWKATWSKPRRVDKESCGEFAVGIDPSSRYHVITSCGLRYSVTNADGQWTTTSLGDSKEHGALIAFDGDQAYIAYWRELPWSPDTCGGFQLQPSAGVFYRHRTLPDGGWSKAVAFGKRGDHLTAFRVDGGVLHAIVLNGTSESLRTFYVRSTQDPVVSARHRIDTSGGVSLRVGDDGRARVAYWAGTLRYGTFNGSGFSSSKISDGPTDGPAMLLLGPGNQPHVAYTIARQPEGCGDAHQVSRAGTYYATIVDGKWQSHRITKHLGLSSFALDPGTGRVHLIEGNTLHTKEASRAWVAARLPAEVDLPVMRVDPETGALLVVYLRRNANGESEGLFAITTR